jgi:hypothetical protein
MNEPAILTVVGFFPLGACELINCDNCTENIKLQRTTFNRPDDQVPGICAILYTHTYIVTVLYTHTMPD